MTEPFGNDAILAPVNDATWSQNDAVIENHAAQVKAQDEERDWWDALRKVVDECANDGDSHVEYYGRQMEDLLRLRGEML